MVTGVVKFIFLWIALSISCFAQINATDVFISEFLASNQSGIDDGNKNRRDWVELTNPTAADIDLTGYHLTDDDFALNKWTFPTVSIPANGTLLIFCSGDDQPDAEGNLHTNFSLNSAGEFLALVRPNGSDIVDSFSPEYPVQFPDRSYGRVEGSDEFFYFQTPTPRATNTNGADGIVEDTEFDINRGFYDTPFNLTISSNTSGARIHYTTDGSLPTPTTGTLFVNPIPISTTTNVRAIAFLPNSNWIPTNVDTHTYIFVDDVAQQPATPEGWATDWGFDDQIAQAFMADTVTADYEMDPRVVNDVLNLRGEGYSIRDALLDIPTVSLTLRQRDIVMSEAEKVANDNTSLYGTPRERVEKFGSIEYILPDGTEGFQEDVVIETHGNSSRTPFRMQKHSIRISFRSSVGVGKLRYNLFPDSPVNTFNKLVLRACFTDSWALNTWATDRYRPNDSLYMRDVWMKDSFGDMGQPTSYGNFVHLYLNGLYFGVHDLTERIEDDFFSEHLGGEKEDWEINDNFDEDFTPPAGEISQWETIENLLSANPESIATFNTVSEMLDIENYIDYLILHFYVDAEDWPRTNGYAAVNSSTGDGKYRFWVWDQEIVLDKFTWDYYTSARGSSMPVGGSKFFGFLRQNPEFMSRFADRVYKHLHDGGALTAENSGSRVLEICQEIDKAIIAESARWGDVQTTTPYGDRPRSSSNSSNDNFPPLINSPVYFTREQHWIVERDHLVNTHIPALNNISNTRSLIRELQERGFYPDAVPPVFSTLGGNVPSGFPLKINALEGTTYYTLDDSDPRLVGGMVNPDAIMIPPPITEEIFPFESSDWLILANGIPQSNSDVVIGHPDYDQNDWKHPDFDDSQWDPGQGPMADDSNGIRNVTSNTTFQLQHAVYFRREFNITNSGQLSGLEFNFIRDDGCVVYLNGKEIFRDNMESGTIEFGEFQASSASPEDEIHTFRYALEDGDLIDGVNVLAVEVHNSTMSSPDLGLDLSLTGLKVLNNANLVSLGQSGLVKARTLVGDEWSPLRQANFIVGNAAGPGELVFSDIMYHPAGPDEAFEFFELTNTTNQIIDLSGVTVSGTSQYTFPTGYLLTARTQVVVALNRELFVTNHEPINFIIAPGSYTSNLSNGGGLLELHAADGTLIQSFSYDDEDGWPMASDDGGPSLEIIDPFAQLDPTQPGSWRVSATNGGTPGTFTFPFPSAPDADLDGDGVNALAEYFFGTSDLLSSTTPVSLIQTPNGPMLEFGKSADVQGVSRIIEFSSNLEDGWDTDPSVMTELAPITDNPDGRIYERFMIEPNGLKRFIRIRVVTN